MSTPALNPLVTKIRTMHPGAYDDLDDAALTKAVLTKYPQYSDLAAPGVSKPSVNMQKEPLSWGQQRVAQTAENAVSAGQVAKDTADSVYDVSAPGIATEIAKHLAGRPNGLKKLPAKMVMAWLAAGGLPEGEAAEVAPAKAALPETAAAKAEAPSVIPKVEPPTSAAPMAKPARTIVVDPATGRPEFSDVKAVWPPPEPTGAYDKVPKAPGGIADALDDQAAREEVQARIEQSDRKWMKDAARQYRDRNDPSTPKGVLTGTADKPVTLTKTPGVKATAPVSKSVGTPAEADLIDLLQKSLDAARARKAGR
jgi:hypothetical protein